MDIVERRRCFRGTQLVIRHAAARVGCTMHVAVFLPPQAETSACPVLYWLSGLTCTEQNFITKAGAQRYAAEHGVILVAPDTSPRGADVADAEGYDIGLGAGFYVNATEAPWAAHYQMAAYVERELPAFIDANFRTTGRQSILGHSMGGHGALTIALRNPRAYASVSAFSPIVAPTQVPWGRKVFAAYLGPDESTWQAYDACALVANAEAHVPMRIDQGTADEFLHTQLRPELLQAACQRVGYPLDLRMQEGYDHSYYFIASFIGEHIAFHAEALRL
ncbi:S-formylglutathione hydrolase [Ahniella affigens]|uniref:S-formylglutathione hydrolase n=1 Tax=Ahniella affigens TaxID=2021234 RepID=A0A2P1PTU6_9GAMM|nr:S-formylglutathione hydrolase [Ahniella affigens]AVP98263.1 S-formylglutathione hydrolase [Ahniella affigens]